MKKIGLIILLFLTTNVKAQEGFHLGVEISPAFVLNSHRNLTTSLRSSESGYGFNVGVPLKYFWSEYMGLESGLTFEYMAFDNRFNNTLISSNRFGSLNMPLTLIYQVAGDWYVHGGVGAKYQFLNRAWSGFAVDIGSAVNKVQPYVALGVSTFLERDKGIFELGVMGRYHFLNLWNESSPQSAGSTSKIISFDIMLKFFLFNS
jgi:hypothetical protein